MNLTTDLRQELARLQQDALLAVSHLNAAVQQRDEATKELRELIRQLRPMVEAYRLWATGRMNASRFGEIADRAVIAFDAHADQTP